MDKKCLMTNFKVMFTMYLLLVLFVIMFLFSFPIRVNALEVSDWTESNTLLISEVDSAPYYTYDNYDSSAIMNYIYNWSNERFFESSYTIEDFYSNFTYVIYSVDQSTVRAYVQNSALVLDWQGISSTSDDIIFYLSNVVGTVDNGSRYAYGVGIIYSYYIDINLDNLSYTISDNNPLLDVTMQRLTQITSSDTSSILNIKMLDSYNGNISWISTWYDLYNNSGLWRTISGYTGSSYITYSTNPNAIIPDFLYTSPGVTPVPPDEPDEPDTPPEEDDSVIGGLIDRTNEILEGIGSSVINIEEWFKGAWNTEPLENLYEKFIIEDFGESNFFLLIIDYLDSLSDSIDTCEPIVIDIPFLNTADKITLPCMTDIYEDISPRFLEFYQLITTGLISFFIILNVYDTIVILLDPTTDLWHANRSNSDIVKVNSKTGEVVE